MKKLNEIKIEKLDRSLYWNLWSNLSKAGVDASYSIYWLNPDAALGKKLKPTLIELVKFILRVNEICKEEVFAERGGYLRIESSYNRDLNDDRAEFSVYGDWITPHEKRGEQRTRVFDVSDYWYGANEPQTREHWGAFRTLLKTFEKDRKRGVQGIYLDSYIKESSIHKNSQGEFTINNPESYFGLEDVFKVLNSGNLDEKIVHIQGNVEEVESSTYAGYIPHKGMKYHLFSDGICYGVSESVAAIIVEFPDGDSKYFNGRDLTQFVGGTLVFNWGTSRQYEIEKFREKLVLPGDNRY